jgi:hypothetical protein
MPIIAIAAHALTPLQDLVSILLALILTLR